MVQAFHRHVPILIRELGSSYKELLHIISDPPKGSENLLTLVLQILTQEVAPSSDLIATVKHLYETKLKDVSILIPLLSSLTKDEVLPIFPLLLNLPPEKFQLVLAHILQGSARTGLALTPAEVLIAIHDVVPEKNGPPLKKITDACSACFEQRTVFTQQVLAKALGQMAIDAFPTLAGGSLGSRPPPPVSRILLQPYIAAIQKGRPLLLVSGILDFCLCKPNQKSGEYLSSLALLLCLSRPPASDLDLRCVEPWIDAQEVVWLLPVFTSVYKLRAAPPACVSSPREASGFGFNGVYLSLHRSGLPGPPSSRPSNSMDFVYGEPTLRSLLLVTIHGTWKRLIKKFLICFVQVDFVMEILSKLVSRQIWRLPKLWPGFLKCVSQTQPHSFPVLLELPMPQLESIMKKFPDLRPSLIAYANQPTIRASLPKYVLSKIKQTLRYAESFKFTFTNAPFRCSFIYSCGSLNVTHTPIDKVEVFEGDKSQILKASCRLARDWLPHVYLTTTSVFEILVARPAW
ncbi:hypothetical protein Bca4012_006727 [Brassica carinata]